MSNVVSASQARIRLSTEESSFISQLAMSGRSRDLPTAIALAIAACRDIALPGGDVHSPEEYFLQQVGVTASDAISVINELVPVDYRTAIEQAKNLYLIRYEMAQKPFANFGVSRQCGLSSIFGLTAHLPNDVIECIKNNGREITGKSEMFYGVIKSLIKG